MIQNAVSIILNMKFTIIFFHGLILANAYGQSSSTSHVNKPLSINISGGTSRQEFITSSLNKRINGINSFEYLISAGITYDFGKNNMMLSSGVQLVSFTNIYETSSTINKEFDSKSRTIIGGTGYFKVSLNYHYKLRLSKNINLIPSIGPSINVSRTQGVYDNYQSFFQETQNNVVIKTVLTNYYTERLEKATFTAQFGFILEAITKRRSSFFLSSFYNIGYNNFNRTNIVLYVNNNFADEANIYSKLSGLNVTCGLRFPINL